ncbi:thioredoxin [soil metagenome]
MIDSTYATFQADVIDASNQQPVLVDFWAPWCAPCRTLGPILEKLEAESNGGFKLVKMNADENPELSQMLRIRSIPHVVAFVGGRPVDQFTGALPESQLRQFVERLLPSPSELEHARAQDLIDAGDFAQARLALEAALQLDAVNDAARLDLAGVLLELEEPEAAAAQLGALAPVTRADAQLAGHIEALQARVAALQDAKQLPSSPELEARVAANGNDLRARLDLANLYIAHKAWEPALDQLVEIVERDRAFEADVGRTTMIKVLDMASANPELVSRYRRRLSSAVLK